MNNRGDMFGSSFSTGFDFLLERIDDRHHGHIAAAPKGMRKTVQRAPNRDWLEVRAACIRTFVQPSRDIQQKHLAALAHDYNAHVRGRPFGCRANP